MAKPWNWPIEKMIVWYLQGMTCEEIAEHLNTRPSIPYVLHGQVLDHFLPGKATAKNVQRVLKRSGCQMRPTGAPASRNGNWKGGVRYDKGGYVLRHAPDHPHATKAGYVRVHRLVMEERLGRYLLPTEVVHHVDDDPTNNDIANLLLFDTQAMHVSVTMTGKVPASRIAKARSLRWKGHKRKTSPKRKASGGAA